MIKEQNCGKVIIWPSAYQNTDSPDTLRHKDP